LKMFVSEAVSKGLINFSNGTFTNPSTGQSVKLGEAIKMGLLVPVISKSLYSLSLMLESLALDKARNLPIEWNPVKCSFWVWFSLAHK